jgi:hypothetical protein
VDQSSAEAASFIQQFQILITGAFAVVAALVGFGGVWYAQFRIAKSAQEEREHRERVSAQERARTVSDRRITLIHALTGELSSLYEQSNRMQDWFRIQHIIYDAMAKDLGEDHEHELHMLTNVSFETIIFDTFVCDIGLLPPSITASIAKIYGQFRAYKPIEYGKPVSLELLAKMYEAIQKSFTDLSGSTHDLIMRLHAIRLGHDDPGEGKGSEFADKFLLPQKEDLLPSETKIS